MMLSLHRKAVAIDYDSKDVRLLEFSRERGGTVSVHRRCAGRLPEGVSVDDPEGFGKHLSELMVREGIATRTVDFAIARDEGMMHHLSVPATPDDELANLVRFQLSQELPFAIEESSVDYVVTARAEGGLASRLIAGAVKLEHLDRLRHVARAAGLSIRRIGFRPYTSYLACRQAGLLAEGATLFVYLAHETIEIDVFDREEGLLFSRSAGLTEGVEEQSTVERGILQLHRTLPAYHAEGRAKPLGQVVVAGETGSEGEFLEKVQEQLKLTGRLFALPGESGGVEYSACYGLAVGQYESRASQFDFLNPKRAVDPVAQRNRRYQLVAALLIVLLIVGFVTMRRVRSDRQAELARLTAIDEELQDELKEHKRFERQVRQMAEWSEGKVNWLDQLSELTERMPDPQQAYVEVVRLSEARKGEGAARISIQGQAKSAQVVNQMYQTLLQSGEYLEVDRRAESTARTSREYPESFNFEIVAASSEAGAASKPADDAAETAE